MTIATSKDDEEYKLWQLRDNLDSIQAREETHAFFTGEKYTSPPYLSKAELLLERYQEEYAREKGKGIYINK